MSWSDSDLATGFDHLHMYWNESGFDGVWRVRCGTRFQSKDGGPDNFWAVGETMLDCLVNLQQALRHDIRKRAQEERMS